MYNPAAFRETRSEMIEAAMAEHPLAVLVTLGSEGLEASHLPLLYHRTEGGAGVLRGHMARANQQWREYQPGTEALAIFRGPQHYVSPTWYPSTKEHGKVVPTWNYVVVEARGALVFHHGAPWLLENVTALTDAQEKSNEEPWRVEDAPADFIGNMLAAIVGVEMKITRVEGKWKVSQNRANPDREGAVEGLERAGACKMAGLVRAALKGR